MSWQERPSYDEKVHFITEESIDSLVLEREPDFLDYLFFHNVLDKFCFVLKAHYSNRETVKKRRYRLDLVFQNYLSANAIGGLSEVQVQDSNDLESRIEFSLAKGWHNELVRGDPLLPDYLKVGVQLSGNQGPGTGGMAAWNIIQSYFAVFDYFTALAAALSPTLKVDGHKKLARNFNSQIAGAASRSVLYYPFTLSSRTKLSQIPRHPKHTEFLYSEYPRGYGIDINDLDYELVSAFKFIASGEQITSMLDFLYEFRLWANYTGVQSILRLSDGGYLGFLMKNLATLVFFAGGIAELMAILALGENRYLAILARFQRSYIEKYERFLNARYIIPPYVRLRAYKHVGIISRSVDFIIPEIEDPIQFIEIGDHRHSESRKAGSR